MKCYASHIISNDVIYYSVRSQAVCPLYHWGYPGKSQIVSQIDTGCMMLQSKYSHNGVISSRNACSQNKKSAEMMNHEYQSCVHAYFDFEDSSATGFLHHYGSVFSRLILSKINKPAFAREVSHLGTLNFFREWIMSSKIMS